MVLFYVYPLKFLLTVLSRLVSGRGQRLDDGAAVMVGLDFGAVFLVFSLLYAHAHRLRAQLDLDAWERLETANSLRECVAFAGVGFASAAVAAIGGVQSVRWAGLLYPCVHRRGRAKVTIICRRRRRASAWPLRASRHRPTLQHALPRQWTGTPPRQIPAS